MTGASSAHGRARTHVFVQTLFFFSAVFELACLTVNQPITPHLPAGHRNLSSSDISDLAMTTFPHHSTTLRETVALDTKHEQTAAAAMMMMRPDQTTARFNCSSHHALCSAFCTGEWLLCSMFQCFLFSLYFLLSSSDEPVAHGCQPCCCHGYSVMSHLSWPTSRVWLLVPVDTCSGY